MQKYKIKVSWNWIFDDIVAENLAEAKQEARLLASERMDNDNLELSEYREHMNWFNQAKEDAKKIVDEMSEITKEAVEKYKAEKDAEEIADDIYEDFYQNQDLVYKASMQADGYFICNSHDALKDAYVKINQNSKKSFYKFQTPRRRLPKKIFKNLTNFII